MQYGFIIPDGNIHTAPELASEAEAAGWDGVFIPDCISIETSTVPAGPGFDPWIVMAAMAMRTERVRLGPIITAVSRRRPWKLARETATIDHLSKGRLVLAVGLGAAQDDAGFYKVGEAMDRKVRAQLLDEGLEVLAGLWSGKPFSFHGQHYQVDEMTLLPEPVQSPRIPIWVVAAWPRPRSLQRAIRWDGVLPAKVEPDGSFGEMTPEDIRAMKAYVAERRDQPTPFDIVVEGETPGDDRARAAEILLPLAEAGATWWMETRWFVADKLESVRNRIRQGPPRLD